MGERRVGPFGHRRLAGDHVQRRPAVAFGGEHGTED